MSRTAIGTAAGSDTLDGVGLDRSREMRYCKAWSVRYLQIDCVRSAPFLFEHYLRNAAEQCCLHLFTVPLRLHAWVERKRESLFLKAVISERELW